MKIFHMILLGVIILCGSVSCQEKLTQEDPIISDDKALSADGVSVETVVAALYESITFSEGEEPDMERLRSLFIPNALFIRSTPEGPNIMDLEGFISSFKERILSNALTSFYEAEIVRTIHTFGGIAHVFSTYKKGVNTTDPRFLGRGINSIQLFHDGDRWWACSITWEDERSDNPIPEKYLY